MPKAILEFNLPEEQEEYETASNASKYKFALDDIYGELRSIWKYEELNEVQTALMDRVRDIYFRATEGLDVR